MVNYTWKVVVPFNVTRLRIASLRGNSLNFAAEVLAVSCLEMGFCTDSVPGLLWCFRELNNLLVCRNRGLRRWTYCLEAVLLDENVEVWTL